MHQHVNSHCTIDAAAQPLRLRKNSCTLADTAKLHEHDGRGIFGDAHSHARTCTAGRVNCFVPPTDASFRAFCRVELDGACQLEAVLCTELIGDETVEGLLPINALRNAATLPVRTAFIALLDVDLVPSRAFLPSFNARQGQHAAASPALDRGTVAQRMLQ